MTGECFQGLEEIKCHFYFQERQGSGFREYRPVGLTLTPGEMIEQIVLETISEHANYRKVIRSNQCGFTKGISCINNLIAFYGEMTQ